MPDLEILKAKEERDRKDLEELKEQVETNTRDISELKVSSASMGVTLGRIDTTVSDISTKLDEQRQKPAKYVDGVAIAAASALVGAALASMGLK